MYSTEINDFQTALPDKVRDNEQLNNTVDDADGPALYHHRLCRLICEEICYAAPHLSHTTVKSNTLYCCKLRVFPLDVKDKNGKNPVH